MNTATITPERLSNSVIAVPPLARDAELNVCASENAKIMRHLEAGGIRTLLYGGNAVFYHIALAEYADTLAMLQEQTGADTTVVPSVGPAYGTSMDQAAVLRDFDFPTVMVLPARDIATPKGCATGIRKFAEAYGKPIVLYIKFEGYLEPEDAQTLVDDGVDSNRGLARLAITNDQLTLSTSNRNHCINRFDSCLQWFAYGLSVNHTWCFSLQWHFEQVALNRSFAVDWLTKGVDHSSEHAFTCLDGCDSSCALHR